MHKIWAIVRREFLDKVRTKAFLIGTLLFPVLMIGLSLLPLLLNRRESTPKRIAVVDGTRGDVGMKVTEALAAARRQGSPEARYTVSRVPAQDRTDAVRDSLVALVGLEQAGSEALDGVLVLTDESVDAGRLTYLGVNVGSMGDMNKLEGELQTALKLERLRRAGVDPFVAMPALRPVDMVTQKVTAGKLSGESGSTSFILAYVMGLVLYVVMLMYGIQVMSSVVEEKTSRIAEVLMSSVTPFQMMLGKVFGVGAAALLQLVIWGTSATLVTTYRAQLAKLFGASAEAMSSMATMKLPSLRPDLLAVFLIYFVLGFLLFAAMYAAVAAMCNSQQEAQQAVVPVSMTMVVGYVTMFSMLNDPTGSLATTLSLIPLLAPFVVPVRYSLAPIPLPELLLSIALTFGAMLLVVWIAGRIYRVGILLHGKRPKLREVVRWVRA
jgi:ABC-2 type transport system permease protein